MVIPTKTLFQNQLFQGFRHSNEIDHQSIILKNFTWMQRGLAETDPSFKQPIIYSVIVNPKTKKVYAYQRASDENYKETRLKGKWSWGVGGHVDKCDTEHDNPLHASMLRELNEEININGTINPKILGYINNDENLVGQVHFGILYIIETDSEHITPNDGEIKHGNFRTIQELKQICAEQDVEGWSIIALTQLEKYLNN